MEMSTRDKVMSKLLAAQENTRDFQRYADQIDNKKVSEAFYEFAEECALQASELQKLLEELE